MPKFPFPVRYPIFQAPTGSIAGPELCAAVSAAGAVGAMGLTWTEPDDAARAVRTVRTALGDGVPFLVNFALHFPPTAMDAALEAGAPIVSFSWGDPLPFLARVRKTGAFLGVQVTSGDGAKRALEILGVDFVICQGNEAGGHVQASEPLHRTLTEVVDAVGERIPIIAAGGMATGADVVRILRLGADAAMLGTRFVAARESRAHQRYRQALIHAAGEGATALTLCFDGGWTGALHRVLRNSTLAEWEACGCPRPGDRPGEGEVVAWGATGEPIRRYEDTAPRVSMEGEIEAMCLYAGTGVERIHDAPDAASVVTRLAAEMREAGNG